MVVGDRSYYGNILLNSNLGKHAIEKFFLDEWYSNSGQEFSILFILPTICSLTTFITGLKWLLK